MLVTGDKPRAYELIYNVPSTAEGGTRNIIRYGEFGALRGAVCLPEFHPGPKGNKTSNICLNRGDSPSSSSVFILESFCTVEHR
jgi:hypothetical protein